MRWPPIAATSSMSRFIDSRPFLWTSSSPISQGAKPIASTTARPLSAKYFADWLRRNLRGTPDKRCINQLRRLGTFVTTLTSARTPLYFRESFQIRGESDAFQSPIYLLPSQLRQREFFPGERLCVELK